MSNTQDFLTTSMVAEILGVRRQQIWKWIVAGRIKVVDHPGRQYLIRRKDAVKPPRLFPPWGDSGPTLKRRRKKT